jgi:hypothetical protein
MDVAKGALKILHNLLQWMPLWFHSLQAHCLRLLHRARADGWTAHRDFVGAVGADHAQAAAPQPVAQVAQEMEGACIRPLQIIQDQQHRSLAGKRQ